MVPGMHGRALAIDRGVGTFAFHDKPQRRLRMAVAGRDLAGQDQLQSRVEAMGDRCRSTQAGILQDQYAPLRFTGGDEPSSFQ